MNDSEFTVQQVPWRGVWLLGAAWEDAGRVVATRGRGAAAAK